MSLAPSKRSLSTEPAFDLKYSIGDFEVSPHRDSKFLVARMEEVLLGEAHSAGGRILDVACGLGALTARLDRLVDQGYGLDPSNDMLGLGVLLEPERRAFLVRGLAESIPFGDERFDCIVCEGALDHFVHPRAFVSEATRVLRPGGRLVIALANYESLSCRIGRATARLLSARSKSSGERPYWKPPADHHHKGDIGFVQRLGAGPLRLERLYGISMFWLLPGWGKALDRMPAVPARSILKGLDRLAKHAPSLADVIIAVWQKDNR